MKKTYEQLDVRQTVDVYKFLKIIQGLKPKNILHIYTDLKRYYIQDYPRRCRNPCDNNFENKLKILCKQIIKENLNG